MSNQQILISRDLNTLSVEAAALFSRLADDSIQKQNRFSVALSGGSTPKALFDVLAKPPFSSSISWPHVYLFWGDERCVPPDHKDSNFRMTSESLLKNISIPQENIFRIAGEDFMPANAAIQYEQTLRNFFGNTERFPRFDLIFLGMGDDGHTASLFPYTKALNEKDRWVTENYVEKFRSHRITMTSPVINHANNVVFLISGGSKATVLKEVLEGPRDPFRLPSQLIQPESGNLLWMLDEAASKELQKSESR